MRAQAYGSQINETTSSTVPDQPQRIMGTRVFSLVSLKVSDTK